MGIYNARYIERDNSRFRKIVRGAVRSGIRKYLSHGELIGKSGKDLISIPLPQLQIPRFRFGDASQGVGQGQGKKGSRSRSTRTGRGRKGRQATSRASISSRWSSR